MVTCMASAIRQRCNFGADETALPCRFMICAHPEVEAKVVAELQTLQLMPSAEQPQPRSMTYDDIAKITYTSNAIKARP